LTKYLNFEDVDDFLIADFKEKNFTSSGASSEYSRRFSMYSQESKESSLEINEEPRKKPTKEKKSGEFPKLLDPESSLIPAISGSLPVLTETQLNLQDCSSQMNS
jgi:hypothetical protein